MSIAKLAAFTAALVVAAASQASAQSVQSALKAPPHMSRVRLAAWCKSHPTAVSDCKEVRADKAGDKSEAKRDARELKADRKDTRQDRKDRRQDVRDTRKDARK
jgi:hypothetical protein